MARITLSLLVVTAGIHLAGADESAVTPMAEVTDTLQSAMQNNGASASHVPARVVNAASLTSPVAPGSLITITMPAIPFIYTVRADLAPLPNVLGTAAVQDGKEMFPLMYVSSVQINAQLPYDVAFGTHTLTVRSGTSTATSISYTVVPVAPGIFMYGNNRAVAENPDHSLIRAGTNPAKVGTVITVHFTGGGAVSPPVPSGAAAPSKPSSLIKAVASATIAGKPATILFLGLTPNSVGMAQAQLRVPTVGSGDHNVVLTIGGIHSNSPLIAIK